MEQKDFQEEQQYLDRVDKYIDKRIGILTDKKEELRKDIGAGRKSMWENGRHGVCDFDDVVDLYLHSEGIVADEKQYVENLKELQRLEKMKENPYFARIDVVEEEYPEKVQIYIGAVGLRDDKTYDMYVCDWRAPISALFYGFDVGKAWYEVEGRKIAVELTLKRQIQIAEGELLSIYDTNSSMHDTILGSILSEYTGNKLKVIVNSIQKEQNTAIRKIDKQAALIYGPAGSGKTSVGLHRLAYILYHQREKLTAADIVILSNNNIYHSYVEGILPALCEDEVSHTIFHELLKRFLPKGFHIESYYTQYNVLQGEEEHAQARERKAWLEIKYSQRLAEFITDYFAGYEFAVPALMYRGRVVMSAQELQSKYKRNKYGSFWGNFDGLLETVKKLYDDYFTENKEQICEELEASIKEYVSAEELEMIFIKVRKRTISEAMEQIKEQNMLDAELQLVKIMEDFTSQWVEDSRQGCEMTEKLKHDLKKKYLCYEDALLYLLVRIYMGEVAPFQNVLHVLIDEAQDYPVLQLLIMKLLYPKSSFTLLADVCQSISPSTTIQSYEAFEWVFGENLEKLPLLKSYRSSGAINELAFHFMGKFQKEYVQTYSYFEREGMKPRYIVSGNGGVTILKKLDDLRHYNMVGIITANEKDAVKLHHRLQAQGEKVQLITKPYDEMREKILIMPLILSKGLEFDAVIVWNGIGRDTDEERLFRRIYLACTRALHELYFVEERELPEILEDSRKYVQIVHE